MPKQILLVDDSATIHRVVEITFAQEDFALTTVKSADEGIDKAKSLKPDLVLVDSSLGGKSGYDVIAAIRADGGLAHTACLILAGNFSPYDEAKGGSAGADGFIVKPFDTQAMIDKAKDAIQRRVSGGTTAQPVAAMPKPQPAATPAVLSPPPSQAAHATTLSPPPSQAAHATTLPPPPNLAAATARGVETLGKPLSSVAAETSQRISAQPSMPTTATSQPAVPARPASLTPPVAGTPNPLPARPAPKATLMGIPAVNPASIGMTPPAAPAPTATISPAPAPVVAKPNVLAPPPKAAPVAVEAPKPVDAPRPIAVEPPRPAPVAVEAPKPAPPVAHAMPQNVPTMPRPSLVPGVATPTARAPEAPKPIAAEVTPQRGVEAQRELSPAVRDVAQKTVDAIPAALAAKGPEYAAIAKLSREVIEQVVWEIVPELAESIIRAELDRLVRERQNA